MLDELPSLELSATAVALALLLRVVVLVRRRKAGLVRGRSRVESARARDLIGLAILAGAVVYALRVERASAWFLTATAIAVAAQLAGFYLRSAAKRGAAPGAGASTTGTGSSEDEDDEDDEDDDAPHCTACGNASLIELLDTKRFLTGLNQLTPVSAAVCPSCGALTGQVEDVTKIAVGPEHGTALRQGSRGAGQEALEEPTEHDG